MSGPDEIVPGVTVRDEDGGVVGAVRLVYADDETRRPEWVVIDLEEGARFVPVFPAVVRDGEVHVPFSAATIASAPYFDPDAGHLFRQNEADLYDHYDLPYDRTAILAVGQPNAEDYTSGQPAPGTQPTHSAQAPGGAL
ncbi:hypothetical protein [Motilibacter deserti]|uniref:PRC-barrel domain protein n=1 Tax=Motilibacter deserti TaxID=2714956 RepID=A0ABX0GUT2_9ACTN|nr:hypothetical protein [Motilibacter deserti]NHC13896.1 hypothetical protein [Motilibacter deserti]